MTTDRVSVEVVGGARLRRALRQAGSDLADMKVANERVASRIIAASAPSAPRKTGKLASTVRPARAAGRASVTVGNAATPYAGPIHWGWPARNIPANPWIKEAADRTQATWLPEYVQEIERIIAHVERAS